MSTEVKVGGVAALSAIASEEVLQQMRDEFAGLTADTKDGYEEVRKAIRVCVNTRTGIDAALWSLNKEALAWQRKYIAEAKRLTGEVEKIEAPLVKMKAAVDAEAERQRNAWNQLLKRSGLDVSPCKSCGETIICIPDGMPMCKDCAAKGGEA